MANSLAHKSKILTPKELFIDFYRRRIKRIYPALSACLCVTFLISLLLIPPNPAKPFIEYMLTGVFAVAGFSNLLLARQSIDYFGDATESNPFLQTWSLGVEEQFYLILPLAFAISTWCFPGKLRKQQTLVAAMTAAAAAAAISFYHFLRVDIFGSNYFLLISRGREMAAGVLLALLGKTLRLTTTETSAKAKMLDIVVIPTLVVVFFWKSKYSILIAVLAALYICASQSSSKILNSKALLAIGLSSYSIYLWHWPIIWTFRWIGLIPSPMFGELLCLAIIIMASFASYKYIETPYLKKERVSPVHLAAIISTPIGLGILGICSSLAIIPSWFTGRYRFENVDELAWRPTSPQKGKVNTYNVMLIGNSHARHLLPAFYQIGKQHALAIDYTEADTENMANELSSANKIIETIRGAQPGTKIAISSYFGSLNHNFNGSSKLISDERKRWESLINNTIKAAEESKSEVYFFDQAPVFNIQFKNYQQCPKEWFRIKTQSCFSSSKVERTPLHHSVSNLLRKDSASSKVLNYIDLSEEFCSELISMKKQCSTVIDDIILYRDGNHFTSKGAKVVAERIRNSLFPTAK